MERRSRRRSLLTACAVIASVLLGAGAASAQQIGGAITDDQGLALPGVLVEARSPSIIEGVRTVVSDSNGQYLIVALESGTYAVTYTLDGFSTLIREGIGITTGFTASVDVSLAVGNVQETLTVTGAGPIVDIQNNLQRQIIDREVIDSVPTGKDFRSYALLTPGMVTSNSFGTTLNQDAGGITAQTTAALSIHGGRGRDGMTALNGMDVSNAFSGGAGQMFGLVSDGAIEEMSVEVSGHNAEASYGGVTVNLIPREGANQFSGAFFGTFTGAGLQADNLSDALRDRGVSNFPEVDEVWMLNPSFGGPIVENRLWFFGQHTAQRGNVVNPGVFAAVNAAAPGYLADTTQPVVSVNENAETSFNFTLQASQKDKFKVYYSYANWKKPNALAGPFRTFVIAPEASINREFDVHTTQLSWVRPATNRLLFEAGVSFAPGSATDISNEFAASDVLSTFDVASRTIHRNNHFLSQGSASTSDRRTVAFHGSTAYVTGTHSLKFGFNGTTFREVLPSNVSQQNFTDAVAIAGLPLQANFWIPNLSDNRGVAWGFYAQDQMTFDRLTINAGLRFDHLGNSYPDQTRAPSIWEPDEVKQRVVGAAQSGLVYGPAQQLKAVARRGGRPSLRRHSAGLPGLYPHGVGSDRIQLHPRRRPRAGRPDQHGSERRGDIPGHQPGLGQRRPDPVPGPRLGVRNGEPFLELGGHRRHTATAGVKRVGRGDHVPACLRQPIRDRQPGVVRERL